MYVSIKKVDVCIVHVEMYVGKVQIQNLKAVKKMFLWKELKNQEKIISN